MYHRNDVYDIRPTDTIVPVGSSHIHWFNPINLYLSIIYNRIINKICLFPNILKYPYLDHKSPNKTRDVIYWYTPSHLKAYQPNSNLPILTNIWPCKPLVKIFAFWFSDSIFQITIGNHSFHPINLYLSIIYNRIINNIILFPNSPKHPVSDYIISK